MDFRSRIYGEVGGAGASCVNLFQTSFNNHFIIELFPGEGAVACQASFIPGNQSNARNRFNMGDSPKQLINWMINNDIFSDPTARQYGVVRMMPDSVKAVAYTGLNCQNYKNHIVGPNYTIQGNILQGKHILDSMEARFLREPGELACKLMAAMQGANVVGADTRCTPYGTSSLFAFLKVTHPADSFGNPAFLVSLKTHPSDSTEPIDSLQVLFNQIKSCTINTTGVPERKKQELFKIYPNPAGEGIEVKITGAGTCTIKDLQGREVLRQEFTGSFTINAGLLPNGVYFVEVRTDSFVGMEKVVINR